MGSQEPNFNINNGELQPLDHEEFRKRAHQMVDYIADYYKNIEMYPVLSQVQPGYLISSLPKTAPYEGEEFESILKDVTKYIVPGMTHWASPNFFGFFPVTGSWAAFVGEMLCTSFNGVGFNWLASPAATELEMVVVDWLASMLNLPSSFMFSDAAYGGNACICPEFRHYLNGIEGVDSLSINLYKWLVTYLDCCCLWVKSPVSLVKSLGTNPEYLKNKLSDSNSVVEYKDWQIGTSKRFRSLRLWFVLRSYGLEKLQNHIREDVGLAKIFEGLVRSDSRFEIIVPVTFSLVCFRLKGSKMEDLNKELLERVNKTGRVYMTHTITGGIFMLRFVVGSPLTQESHVVAAWKLISDEAEVILMDEKTNRLVIE